MDYDVILIGGGLANSLLTWKLAVEHPSLRLLLIEQHDRLGGNHTWSFYHHDLTAAQRAFLAPVIAHRWPGYDVRFPQLTRRLDTPYCSVTSDALHNHVSALLGKRIVFNTRIEQMGEHAVSYDGRTVTAKLVIDGRGFQSSPHMAYAYQKFVGLEMELAVPHGLTVPTIMDATVAQHDGFRFVYLLPFDDRRVLIEDTYYSDKPDLDAPLLVDRIHAYAAAKQWQVARVIRQEQGVLPITLRGDIQRFWQAKTHQACSGLRAHLFHQTTGYSLLYAMRLADKLAALPDLAQAAQIIMAYSRQEWARQRFYRILNRMLFWAALPDRRYRLLQRFYGLPHALIERFYAGQLPWRDKLRIVTGKPPVPVLKALHAIFFAGRNIS